MSGDGPLADVWELGLPGALVMAPLLKTGQGGPEIMKQMPVLPSVGAAAAALPSVLRQSLAELADCHQVCCLRLNRKGTDPWQPHGALPDMPAGSSGRA